MTIIWLQTSKKANTLKVIYLVLLMPLVVFLCLFLYFEMQIFSSEQNIFDLNNITFSLKWAFQLLIYSLPIMFLWLIVWVYFQKQIIFSFTWAKELSRKDNKELYNIIENLCISRGLPIPKIWIIEDNSLNAFATWWTPKNSHVVFSRWLINKLDKKEIEAVAWHELTHIINWDVRLMVIINVFIWMIWTIWYILLISRSSSENKNNSGLKILWLMLYIVSLLILPLINMAVSRKKEFLADAWSVELTKDKDSMISALRKISKDSVIKGVDKKSSSVKAMFINNPEIKKVKFFSKISNLFSTHPSIEKRIELLEKY